MSSKVIRIVERLILRTTVVMMSLWTCNLTAQQIFPVSVEGMIVSPYSFDLSVYAFERSEDIMFVATLQDPVEPFRLVKFRLSVLNNGQEILATDPNFNPPPIMLEKDIPTIINGSDLAGYFEANNLIGLNGQQGGTLLPEGLNGFCLEVIDVQRNEIISDRFCSFGFFEYSDPPILNMPICGDVIQENMAQNLLFNWIPQHLSSLNPPMGVEYKFRLVELLPDQNAFDAFSFSLPLYEATVNGTSLFYLEDAPLLQAGRQYAWRVRAVDTQNFGLFSNNGYSEVCTFFVEEADDNDGLLSYSCENANCNWTGTMSAGLLMEPIEVGEELSIGYFDMEVSNIQSLDNQYYSGEGFIYVPFLSAKLKVFFDDILVNDDKRIYSGNVFTTEADSASLIPSLFDIQNPLAIEAGIENLDDSFSDENAWALYNYFINYDDGGIPPNLVSLLSDIPEQNAVAITVPIGLDNTVTANDEKQTIAITGARFEPTKAVLNAVMVTRFDAFSDWMKFGAKEFCFQPYGLAQAGSSTLELLTDIELDLLEGEIIVNSTQSKEKGSTLAWDCNGFDNFTLHGNYSYDVNHYLNLELPSELVSSEFTSTTNSIRTLHLDVFPTEQFAVFDTIIENKPWFDETQILRIQKNGDYEQLPDDIKLLLEIIGEDDIMYDYWRAALYELQAYNLLAVDPDSSSKEQIFENAQQAIPLLKSALSIHKDNALDHVLLSEAYVRVDKIDSAFIHSKNAVLYSPKWVVGYNQVASIYLRCGQISLANKWLEKAIDLEPTDVAHINASGFNAITSVFRLSNAKSEKWKLNSLSYKGDIKYDKAKFAEIEYWFRKSIDIKPTPSAYSQLAWSYSRIGELDKAEMVLNEAINSKVAKKEHLKELAIILRKKNQLSKLNGILETIGYAESSSHKEENLDSEEADSEEIKEDSKSKKPDTKLKEDIAQEENVDLKKSEEENSNGELKVDTVSTEQDTVERLETLGDSDFYEVTAMVGLLSGDIQMFEDNFCLIEVEVSDNPDLHYLISRIFALENQTLFSLDYLESAIKLGFDDVIDIERNPDLDNIRGEEKFVELLSILNE